MISDALWNLRWCTLNGEAGSNWNPMWGGVEEYWNQGFSALEACCATWLRVNVDCCWNMFISWYMFTILCNIYRIVHIVILLFIYDMYSVHEPGWFLLYNPQNPNRQYGFRVGDRVTNFDGQHTVNSKASFLRSMWSYMIHMYNILGVSFFDSDNNLISISRICQVCGGGKIKSIPDLWMILCRT